MFRKFHEKLKEREDGFTLIELLVVILIIAILAAIAIPVFLKQREKGWIGAMESSLKDAATAAESYATGDGNGGYVGLTCCDESSTLAKEGWNETNNVTLTVEEATATKFCLKAIHTKYEGDQDPMYYSSEGGKPVAATSCVTASTAS